MSIQTANTAGQGLSLGSGSLFHDKGTFTIACRIRRIGTGTTVSTGTGGLTAIEPIFTGGVGESETRTLNLSFFMGWVPATNKIGLDYEDWNNGLNWPVTSSATMADATDYHLCATYNTGSATWTLYINGTLDMTKTTAATSSQRLPDTGSMQGVGVCIAIASSGSRTGAFNGIVSDVCIWSTDLNAAEVSLLANSKSKRIPLQIQSASLRGFWPLDEGLDGQQYPTSSLRVRDISGRNRMGNAFGAVTSRAERWTSY